MQRYNIVEDFQAGKVRVLVLDRDFEPMGRNCCLYIEGKRYECQLNSIRNWITVISENEFAGKIAEFR